MSNLELWLIGNCQVSALVDTSGCFVWGCIPRVDGDPIFSALMNGHEPDNGYWSIELTRPCTIEQHYIHNTPILVTTMRDEEGNACEVVDFCPYFQRDGRQYRPVAFIRIVRPLAGSPHVHIKFRPGQNWGDPLTSKPGGSNHLRYEADAMPLRLTTSAPVSAIREERPFRLEKSHFFFLGPDEPFIGNLGRTVEGMLSDTIAEWQQWARSLATPLEWQDYVIRSAITLKLCQHEETGAIVAALTTSVPEHANSERNWDYRYCWIRDAYYTVQALNRLGALDVLEGYLSYLRNIVDAAGPHPIQPLYSVLGEEKLDEWEADKLSGYRNMGPVRVGNQAYEQNQHDAFGQIILSSVQAFFDRRFLRPGEVQDFHALEKVGEHAWLQHDQPDAGLWELRTRTNIHTYSAAMCWAACDRLANAAEVFGLTERVNLWRSRASVIRKRIETSAWREDSQRFSATFEGDVLDASLLQLLDMRFLDADDPRLLKTLSALEEGLRRGSYMLRYATEDDFGIPNSAFNVCTFWLIEVLHFTGRHADARALFTQMLERCTRAGLLSEDIDPATGELWGNYPQTYSLVGIINCAVLLSKPWSTVR